MCAIDNMDCAPSGWRHFSPEPLGMVSPPSGPAGTVPVTKASGKSRVVHFRFARDKHLRYALYWFSFVSLNDSEWARPSPGSLYAALASTTASIKSLA